MYKLISKKQKGVKMEQIDYKTMREILIENTHKDLRGFYMNMSDYNVMKEFRSELPYYEIPKL